MTFFIEDPIQTYWDPDVISESLLIKSLEIYDQILGYTTIFWYNRLAAFRFILLYRSTDHTRREWFHLIIIIFTGSFNHWNGIAYYFSRDSFNERRIKKIILWEDASLAADLRRIYRPDLISLKRLATLSRLNKSLIKERFQPHRWEG